MEARKAKFWICVVVVATRKCRWWPRFAPWFWALTWVIRHCMRQTNPVRFPHATWPAAFSAICTVSLRNLYLLPSAARVRSPAVYDLFVQVLERMRCRFSLSIFGYVVMPEHVHLLVSEPLRGLLADAMHYLKLSFAKRWWLAHFGRSATMTATCARSASFARSCVIFIAIQ